MAKKLTQAKIDATRPGVKPIKLSDTDGLFLLVKSSGSRGWRLRYTWAGREKQISLGPYPVVTLKDAREKRDTARRLLANGKDPSAERKAERAARADTFRAVAEEWFAAQPLAHNTRVRNGRVLRYLYKHLGNRSLGEIESPDLLDALRAIENRSPEAAKRARQLASSVYQYAIASRRAAYDPAAGLGKALKPTTRVHRAALTERKAFGLLLLNIDAYGGQQTTLAGLQLLALTFVRPGELRLATWAEVDLDNAQWVIPASRTKMRSNDHVVPLARQAVQIFCELRMITDRGPTSWVLPSLRPRRPISDNTFNTALRTMGYDTATQHCAHGFRSTASTLLHELGNEPDVIECQLAHRRSGVGGIYNRSHRLAERRAMMQRWADYLDELRAAGKDRKSETECLCKFDESTRYEHPQCPAHVR